MTPLPVKVRFWKRKLEKGEPRFAISRTLARRVFYAASFVYISFLVHGWFIYQQPDEAPVAAAPAADDERPLERGVCEPLLEGVLRLDRGGAR